MIDQRDGELEVRLHLRVASGRTEDEAGRHAREGQDGVEGVDRPLAGRERVRGCGVEREAGETVVEHHAGARDHARGAELAENALDERDRVPVAIDDRHIRRVRRECRESAGVRAFARPCRYRAATRAHERTVEKPLDIEARPPRIARVRVAVGERHLLDLDHLVHEVGTPPRVLLHVEPSGDRQLLQQDVALRHGRLPENAQAAIWNGDRLGAIGRMSGEIFEPDVPAQRRQRVREAGAEIAAVERGDAAGHDFAECLREIGLLQDLAGARKATARTEDARALLVETRAAVDESLGEPIAHREPFLGVLDRRRQRALEAEPAVIVHQVRERREHSWHGGDARPALRVAVRERVEVESARGSARSVVRLHLARARVVHQREEIAADAGAMWLRHGAHRRRGDRGVDGAPAFAQHREARRGGEVVIGRHQPVHRADRRPRGHRKMLCVRAAQTSRPTRTRAINAAADAIRRPRPSERFGRGTSGIRARASAASGQCGLPSVSSAPKST